MCEFQSLQLWVFSILSHQEGRYRKYKESQPRWSEVVPALRLCSGASQQARASGQASALETPPAHTHNTRS